MSSAQVRTKFETAFGVAFPEITLLSIDNINNEYPRDAQGRPQDFAATLYFGTEEVTEVGGMNNSARWRESGTINLLLYTLAGRGTAASTADSIRAMFGGTTIAVESPGLRLALLAAHPLTQYLGPEGSPQGPYSVAAIAIDYEYDFIR